MKIQIQYFTKEKIWHSKMTFSYVEKSVSVEAIRIIRTPWHKGPAVNRYMYWVEAIAPTDAVFSYDGKIREPINRLKNPAFNPKKLNFNLDIYEVV